MKKFLVAGVLMIALMLIGSVAYALNAADVLFVVDESGSMSGEHAWLSSMIGDLEAGLVGKGVGDGTDGSNQYALLGYGGNWAVPSHGDPHKHTVGSGDWGTASELATATGGLVIDGSFEDGWAAIDFALNNYVFREGAALNVILITDEDRDVTSGSTLTYNSVLSSLQAKDALLNTVVNATFKNYSGATSLGIDSEGSAYMADGSGGYTQSTGGVAVSGYGTTIADYVDLALGTGGAAWDLNQLRAGGDTAVSFTNAFVDIKVEEIQEQIIPEPNTLLLLGAGLIGVFALGRKKVAKK